MPKVRAVCPRCYAGKIYPGDKHCAFCQEVLSLRRNRRTRNPPKLLQYRNHTCHHCQEGFDSKVVFRAHLWAAHLEGKSFNCTDCPRTFSAEKELDWHAANAHIKWKTSSKSIQVDKESVLCEYCDKSYASQACLSIHVARLHKNDVKKNAPKTRGKYAKTAVVFANPAGERCRECDLWFPDRWNMRQHYKSEHRGRVPRRQSKDPVPQHCQSEPKGRIPKKQNQGPMCYFCQKPFTNQENLDAHTRAVHEGQKDFKCHVCDKEFSTKAVLARHVESTHAAVDDNADDKSQPGTTSFRRPQCEVCLKEFSSRDYLGRHVAAMHLESRDWECSICHRRFPHRLGLNRHLNSAHHRPKCHICHREFSSRNYVNLHVAAVHKEDRDFPCHLCDKRFPHHQGRSMHVKRVHESNKKVKLEQTSDLSVEDAVAKKYDCDLCDMKFVHYQGRSRHVRKVHDNMFKETSDLSMVDDVVAKELTVGKDFACDLCNKKFVHHQGRSLHVKRVHGSQVKTMEEEDVIIPKLASDLSTVNIVAEEVPVGDLTRNSSMSSSGDFADATSRTRKKRNTTMDLVAKEASKGNLTRNSSLSSAADFLAETPKITSKLSRKHAIKSKWDAKLNKSLSRADLRGIMFGDKED